MNEFVAYKVQHWSDDRDRWEVVREYGADTLTKGEAYLAQTSPRYRLVGVTANGRESIVGTDV